MKPERQEDADNITTALGEAWDESEGDDNGSEQQGDTVLESVNESGDTTELNDGEHGVDADTTNIDEDGIRQGEEDNGSVDQGAAENEKPPVGLSPAAREDWKDVPDSVKADIVKRENDYASGIEKHRAASARVQGMDKALAPYQQYLQMNGGPGPALNALLQTGSGLQMGSPHQKAEIISNLIKQFGVDIKSLDSMLVGEQPSAEANTTNQFQTMLNTALAPMQQQLNQYQQREQVGQQQAQNQISTELVNFASSHEFYNDVKMDMADILDMAANREREMSMEDAYKLACSSHPQISKVISGRISQSSVDVKRRAASSISGAPGGTMSSAPSNSVLSALNTAWDESGQM